MPLDHDLIPRLRELADRLVAPGGKAEHVSCSETHEIREGLIAALDELEQRPAEGFFKLRHESYLRDEHHRQTGTVRFGTNSEEDGRFINQCMYVCSKVPKSVLTALDGGAKFKLLIEFA